MLLGLLVVIAVAVLWPRGSRVPEAFVPFSTQLRSADRLSLSVGWPDGPLPPDAVVDLVLGPGASAQITAQSAALAWSGGAVTMKADGLSIPLLDLTDRADDLYGSLRSGLRDSAWTLTGAPRIGMLPIRPEATWASVQLPHDWADGTALLLAVDGEGALVYLALEGRQAPFVARATPMRGGVQTVTLSASVLVRLPVRHLEVD